jgi:hypothetical protein
MILRGSDISRVSKKKKNGRGRVSQGAEMVLKKKCSKVGIQKQCDSSNI